MKQSVCKLLRLHSYARLSVADGINGVKEACSIEWWMSVFLAAEAHMLITAVLESALSLIKPIVVLVSQRGVADLWRCSTHCLWVKSLQHMGNQGRNWWHETSWGSETSKELGWQKPHCRWSWDRGTPSQYYHDPEPANNIFCCKLTHTKPWKIWRPLTHGEGMRTSEQLLTLLWWMP